MPLHKRPSFKISFKLLLSEMYLLYEKAQPLSLHCEKRQPSFPFIKRVIEERRYHISKYMITLSTGNNLKNDTFSTGYAQNMVTFSAVISNNLQRTPACVNECQNISTRRANAESIHYILKDFKNAPLV